MAADAIALFRPKNPERLKPFLDLDDESDESDGLYAEALADGAFLVHTFQPYDLFANNPVAVGEWVQQFGDAWPEVHDDPRGLFMFPDAEEPEATTYDGVIEQLAEAGMFLPVSLDGGAMPDLAALAGHLEASGIDLGALQNLAGNLMSGMQNGNSFDIGKLMTDMNQELLGSIAAAAKPPPDGADTATKTDEPAAPPGAPDRTRTKR